MGCTIVSFFFTADKSYAIVFVRSDILKRLLKGAAYFMNTNYENNKDCYVAHENMQNPHTLFITCCDSRIIPSHITSTGVGELFVIRNIANQVPTYDRAQEDLSTSSAIEYAVNVLKVENIVICGHRNCGGCTAMAQEPAELHHVPYTREWVNKDTIDTSLDIEKENIKKQLSHLLTYPMIKEQCDLGNLHIAGWLYDIGQGDISYYDQEVDAFQPISELCNE